MIGRGGGHWYRVGKSKDLYPSVTSVTGAVLNKPALLPWAKKIALENVRRVLREERIPVNLDTLRVDEAWIDAMIEKSKQLPEQIAEKAADLGTRAHAAIDQMLKKERPMSLDGIEADLHKPVGGFLEWYPTCPYTIEHSEIRLASHQLGVGGSMDAFFRRKDSGIAVVGDWKTSKGIFLEMLYQVGGYSLCWEEMTGEAVDEACIIRFPKTIDDPLPFEVKTITGNDLGMAKAGFAMAKGLYDIAKSGLIPERFVPQKSKRSRALDRTQSA